MYVENIPLLGLKNNHCYATFILPVVSIQASLR
jgi:hypothetical protein